MEEVDLEEDLKLNDHLIDKGTNALSGAKKNHEILETAYKRCIDYKAIDELRENIWSEIIEFM